MNFLQMNQLKNPRFLFEVIHALARDNGATKKDLETARRKKEKSRGSFHHKIILDSIEE